MDWKNLLILAGFCLLLLSTSTGTGASDLYVYSDSEGSVLVTHYALAKKGLTLLSIYKSSPKNGGGLSYNRKSFSGEIQNASIKYGVEENLIRAVIKAESDFDPYAISSAGAQGLMQLMPETAKRMGVEDSFNPAQNIDGGARYLMQLQSMFDDSRLAIAAYHAGENNVTAYGDIPPIPATQTYVSRVLRYYDQYKNGSTASSTISYKNTSSPAHTKIYRVILPNGEILYTTSPTENPVNP
ncbi:MAG: lytic transglycosylase domain-containing protein [bacterium]